MSMTDKKGASFVKWFDHAIDKGLLKRNTAIGYRTACQKVLEIKDDWESLDVSKLDVDELLKRFENLRASEYTPKTLDTYNSRFRKGVEMYLRWAEAPSSWRPPVTKRSKELPQNGRSDLRVGTATAAGEQAAREESPVAREVQMLTYPFPLGSNRLAQLELPSDLRSEEARRLAAFVQTLALDSDTGTDEG